MLWKRDIGITPKEAYTEGNLLFIKDVNEIIKGRPRNQSLERNSQSLTMFGSL